jgi:C4-dicarboxylate transporter DctQ subunit
MDKIIKGMDVLFKWIMLVAVALLLLCVLLVNVSVLLRYVFSVSFQWTEEMARYLHIGIVILLLGPLVWKSVHINMDLIIQKTRGKTKKIIRIAGELATLFLITYTFIYAYKWVAQLLTYRIKTFSTVFEQWQPSMIIPLGFGIAVLFNIALLLKEIARFNKEDEITQSEILAEARGALESVRSIEEEATKKGENK